jgi:pimeloyl-ACP methyl ester carboxylesterase
MLRTHRSLPFVVVIALSVACDTPATQQPSTQDPAPEPTAPEPAAAAVELPIHLVGAIEIPGGVSLRYFAKIEKGESGPVGKLSIPDQGAKDVDLASIEVSAEAISFELAPARAKWTGKLQGDAIECSFEQGGAKLPCKMAKVTAEQYAAAGETHRKQDPKPPFPYDVEDVTYANGEVKLAGTLTVPKGGPHAVALLVSGSGAQDRNSQILGHKPFWVLADHLSRQGIAVLRVDDRGVGGSTGRSESITMLDFSADVQAGVAFLRAHERIDPKKIGLVAHSEGGAVVVHVAAADPELAFVVTLAGPGVNGGDLLVAQAAALARVSGATDEQIRELEKMQARAMEVVRKSSDAEKAKAELKKMFDPTGAGGDAIDAQLAIVGTPWFRTFVSYDPAKDVAKLRMPVLALNGSLDMQVVAKQNLPALRKALAKNKKAKVQELEGLNHLFQHATTGSPAEYGTIEETIDPAVLELVASFVKEAT